MLNIKIYVGIDGDITHVEKDFDIYAGEFQSKLLSFYVPKSLVTSNYYFTDASDMIVVGSNNHIENYEDTAGDSINLTAVQFARKFISRSGAISFSGTFYAHFNKEVSVGGKEYVLFSRTLPYEMTQNDTNESVDNIMVLNVLNITRSPIYEDDSITGYKNTAYRIATTQEISLPILPSQYLSGEPVDDAGEYSALINEIIGDVDQLQTAVTQLDNTKQDKIDDGLETTSNSVVGAINEVNAQAQQNAEDIANIEEKAIQGFRFIGEITNVYDPENAISLLVIKNALIPLLYQELGLDYSEKENGDTVIYIYSMTNDTDRNYRFIYTVNGWAFYKLPDMELASDNNAGLIKGGTSGVISTHIVAGLINNISVDGISLSNIASQTASNTEIINDAFTEVSGEYIANKAIADKAGNDISTTYMTVLNGATKDFVREYAMPANYSNLYFITTGGYVDNAPTSVSPQFTNTLSNIGTQTIFSLTRTFGEPYRINKNNAIKNEIYVESDKTISVEFTLTTVIKGETASIIRSGTKTLTAGEMDNIVLEGNLILLGTDELEVAIGDTMQQVLQVTVQTLTDTATLDLYSNETYPSTFNFSIGSIGGSASPTLSKAILPYDSDFSYSAGVSVFDVNTGAMYTSLVDGNVGHLLSDTTYWRETSYVSKTATENVGGVKTFVDGIIAKTFEVRFDSNNRMTIEVASNGVTTLRHYRNGSSYMVQLPTWAGVIACINQIFPTYSSSATYSVGDLVNYNNLFYRCTTAVTSPEDFDSNKWTITTLSDELKTIQNNMSALQTDITNIQSLIPEQASSSNQLADKNFVNSSIATNTANFIGTFSNIVDLENYSGTLTDNDYAFVTNKVINNGNPFNSFNDMISYVTPVIDYVVNYDYAFVINANDNTKIDVYRYDISQSTIAERWGENNPVATAIDINDFQKNPAYNRYKYTTETTPAEWRFEYTLNNSSFTASQWAAINSGITADKVADMVTLSDTQTITGAKTFDNQVTFSNSGAAGTNNLTIKNDNGYNANIKMGSTENLRLMTGGTYFGAEASPITDSATDLGNTNAKWRNLYVGSISDGTNSINAGDIASKELIGEEYDNTQTYAVNDIVIYNNKLYKCTTAVSTAEDFDSTKWTQITVQDLSPELSNYVNLSTSGQTFQGNKTLYLPTNNYFVLRNSAITNQDFTFYLGTTGNYPHLTINELYNGYRSILGPNSLRIYEPSGVIKYDLSIYDRYISAKLNGTSYRYDYPRASGYLALSEQTFPAFSTSSTYSIGDLVSYQGQYYRCTTAVTTAGAWTGSTNWTATTVADELPTAMTTYQVQDIVAQSLYTTYTITVNVTNGAYVGNTVIGNTAEVVVTANSGYSLPASITVTGATYTWNDTTGKIELSAPTGNVTISVVCA